MYRLCVGSKRGNSRNSSMKQSPNSAMESLLAVMERLRDPKTGCPWDIEQDFRSIAPSTIEEAYEVVDAIEQDDFEHLREELGDLLFQVVFYAQMAKEQNRFNFADIAESITNKLLRRHPHVFPDGTLESQFPEGERPDEAFVAKQWEQIKAAERSEKGKTGLLDDIPTGLPELVRARKLQKRAAEIGFDWPNVHGVLDKIHEEIGEVTQAIAEQDKDHIEEEIGDCLFALVNLCRHLDCDAGTALRRANQKFSQRFEIMEEQAKAEQKPLDQYSLKELDEMWNAAKQS